MAGLMGMKIWTVVACVVVGVLGLLTVILGIAGTASAAQSLVLNENKVSCEDSSDEVVCRELCEYQASPAVGCGIVAALLALTTQIVATAATGCCGCCRSWGIPSEAKRIVALVLSTFSWIISITVVILFMVGAIVIGTAGDVPTDSRGRCVPSGTGEFASATILFIITVIFQIGSYILLEATTVSKKQGTEESGIATGQPAEPLENADKKAAVVCAPPPSAPDASSEVNVDPPAPSAPAASTEVNVDPPVHSVPSMSPKASADSTSQV